MTANSRCGELIGNCRANCNTEKAKTGEIIVPASAAPFSRRFATVFRTAGDLDGASGVFPEGTTPCHVGNDRMIFGVIRTKSTGVVLTRCQYELAVFHRRSSAILA